MPSLIDRILRRRRPVQKESRVARLAVQSGHGGAIYSDQDYEKFSKETYLKNIIAYQCIEEIARSAALPSWGVWERPEGEGEPSLVETHEMSEVLKRPNPNESFNFLVLRAVAFLTMAGNSFIERVVLSTRETVYPKELFVLRPDRVSLLMNKVSGQISGYEYRIGGGHSEVFEVDPITGQGDLLQLRLFHPTDDFWGASPVMPASRDIDSNNEATDWNMSLLRNQGRPGMVFSLIGDISDAEFDRFEKHLATKFTGPENVGKNLILTGESGTKAEPYSYSPAEMEFIEGNKELCRNISRAFGVPPMLLGIPGDNTYSNYKEARLAFWEDTVTFYLRLLVGELNNWLFTKEDRLFLKYNSDDISALESRWETRWKRANESSFLSINEKRDLTGYPTWGKGGDVILVGANLIPLEAASNEDGSDASESSDELDRIDEGEGEGDDEKLVSVSLRPDEYEFIMDLRETDEGLGAEDEDESGD